MACGKLQFTLIALRCKVIRGDGQSSTVVAYHKDVPKTYPATDSNSTWQNFADPPSSTALR